MEVVLEPPLQPGVGSTRMRSVVSEIDIAMDVRSGLVGPRRELLCRRRPEHVNEPLSTTARMAVGWADDPLGSMALVSLATTLTVRAVRPVPRRARGAAAIAARRLRLVGKGDHSHAPTPCSLWPEGNPPAVP